MRNVIKESKDWKFGKLRADIDSNEEDDLSKSFDE